MPSPYLQDIYLPDLRLCLLRLLLESDSESLGASVLHSAAVAMGFREDRDVILEQLRYLAGHEAVTLEELGEDVHVATITHVGENHVKRIGAPRPGVKRPRRR